MRVTAVLVLSALMVGCAASGAAGGALGGFEKGYFDEQVLTMRVEPGVRVLINASAASVYDPQRPTLLVFYTTPAGNTIEQTMGCKLLPGMDWHFDIQHIAAQIRRLREVDHDRNIVVACMEPDGRSWPAWRSAHAANVGELVRKVESAVLEKVPGNPVRVVLAGHSAGGSFMTGYVNAYEHIPDRVERIIYLDANYSYSDDEHHGDKLLEWLCGDEKRQLVVVAYDDRNITLDGKLVVSPTGGTFRASGRMMQRFEKEMKFTRDTVGEFDHASALDGRIQLFVHPNPKNEILHTVLVGEMNGLLEGLTLGTELEKAWGTFGGPRAYSQWIQPAPAGAATRASAATRATQVSPLQESRGRAAFLNNLLTAPVDEREKVIAQQIIGGNRPAFLGKFKDIHVSAKDSDGVDHRAVYQVSPDYLSVGTDTDFVRMPLTPIAGQAIAEKLGCVLPTRKIVNDIYEAAEAKLEPRPMTENREKLATFVEHNGIVEAQRKSKPLGLLVAGIKKDIVVTNRLKEKPARAAIYGWHQLSGKPIQPLTIVHGQSYVDYSHGVRLVKREMSVDGKAMNAEDVLADPKLCVLLSDEGPIEVRYPTAEKK